MRFLFVVSKAVVAAASVAGCESGRQRSELEGRSLGTSAATQALSTSGTGSGGGRQNTIAATVVASVELGQQLADDGTGRSLVAPSPITRIQGAGGRPVASQKSLFASSSSGCSPSNPDLPRLEPRSGGPVHGRAAGNH